MFLNSSREDRRAIVSVGCRSCIDTGRFIKGGGSSGPAAVVRSSMRHSAFTLGRPSTAPSSVRPPLPRRHLTLVDASFFTPLNLDFHLAAPRLTCLSSDHVNFAIECQYFLLLGWWPSWRSVRTARPRWAGGYAPSCRATWATSCPSRGCRTSWRCCTS